jgi:5'-deoxynucleotidase YfbR-like HD superfamily hydrolase
VARSVFPAEAPALLPTRGQQQTQAAREAFKARFPSPEARSEHYRELARRANEGRVVLSADEAAALGQAYALLTRIAQRGKLPVEAPPPNAPEPIAAASAGESAA